MRYFELKGSGRLAEITEGEYEFILRKGINYLGVAYIAMEGTPSY